MILVFLAYCFAAGVFNNCVFGGCCCNCDCLYSAYVPKYEPEKKFPMVGQDIYVVDNINNVDEFKRKYGVLYSFDYCGKKENIPTDLTPKEERNLARFVAGGKKVLDLYNHHQEWRVHFYNLNSWVHDSSGGMLSEFLTYLAKKIGTTGGNNFDWENAKDIERWFESFRSKIRNNKNVLIFNLDNVSLRKKISAVVETFKRMISFSYCPEIIFLHKNNLDVNNLYNLIENTEKQWEKNNAAFYPPEGTHSNKGWLVREERFGRDRIEFVQYNDSNIDAYNQNMGQMLKNICFYHNMADTRIKDTDINVALTGWKRSGKTTIGNLLVKGRIGKSSNDFSSVTRNATVYHHSNPAVNFAVVDTPGIEEGEDYAKLFLNWFCEPAENDNYEFYVTNEDMDFRLNRVTFSVKDNYLYASTDRGGANGKIVENLRKKGVDITKRPEKVRTIDENGKQREKIDIVTKINGTQYCFSCVLSGSSYVAKKVKLNKDFIHCIVHLLAPRNFKLPKDWSWASLTSAAEKPFFKPDELELFKKFKELKIPVVFAVNFNGDMNNALIYLRKLFADLALSKAFVDLDHPPANGFASSFLSPLYSRGTILNLGTEGPNPKCGVTRLLQVIFESITHVNCTYGIPFTFADLNLPKIYETPESLKNLTKLFVSLNNTVREHGYALDEKIEKKNPFFGNNLSPFGKKGSLPLFQVRPMDVCDWNDLNEESQEENKPVKYYFLNYPEGPYYDKFSNLFDKDLKGCLDTLIWFATDRRQKFFWNTAKLFLRDVTNNWAIGNKKYFFPVIGKLMPVPPLELPQFAGFDNSKSGWHEGNGRFFLLSSANENSDNEDSDNEDSENEDSEEEL